MSETATPGGTPPAMEGVLETVLYYSPDEEQAVERFYTQVLGMRPIGRSEGRFLFFRAGSSVVLLFERDTAVAQDRPPPHGPGHGVHVCFAAAEGRYDQWREWLAANGVEITDELEWPRDGRSVYFLDPAGNVLEIANRDFWPG